MIIKRGTDRGSALVGRSVHNQRIERLWRDVYRDVLDLFYGIFMSMEDIGILDPINEIDIWCLHYCFCHVINTKLKSWANAWIRHPLSSEQNKTPLQLWVQGNFENAERVLQDQSLVGDDYGVNWDGPASSDAYYEQDVEVDETVSPISQQQLDQLNAEFVQNCPINPSSLDSVRSYQFVKNFILQRMQQRWTYLYYCQSTFLELHINVKNFKSRNLKQTILSQKELNRLFVDKIYDLYYSL